MLYVSVFGDSNAAVHAHATASLDMARFERPPATSGWTAQLPGTHSVLLSRRSSAPMTVQRTHIVPPDIRIRSTSMFEQPSQQAAYRQQRSHQAATLQQHSQQRIVCAINQRARAASQPCIPHTTACPVAATGLANLSIVQTEQVAPSISTSELPASASTGLPVWALPMTSLRPVDGSHLPGHSGCAAATLNFGSCCSSSSHNPTHRLTPLIA